MNRINLHAVAEEEQRSPTGKFHSFARNISVALGGLRSVGPWGGGHPFDFQIRRLPPGAAVCPFHSHLAQWELFLVHRGHGTVRAGALTRPVRTGDVFVHPPGEAHQLINTGAEDLEVFIFADNPPLDAFHYPDSDKWGLRPPGKIFRIKPADYFDGEETPEPGSAAPRPPAAPPPPEPTPFAQRLLNIDDVAWSSWTSPKGRFRDESKELSIGLGAKRNAASGLGGHPFDLTLTRVAPGALVCPYHWHAAQWEMYIVLNGTATVRTASGVIAAGPGEVVLHPPFDPHQLANHSDAGMTCLIVADNPPVDYWHYPDSGKWGVREPRTMFRMTNVDYFDGEE
jgi:uncharacterized cupin superfamily protein